MIKALGQGFKGFVQKQKWINENEHISKNVDNLFSVS